MQDSLTKVQEDVAALSASVQELTDQLNAAKEPSVADNVLAAVTPVLVAAGWTEPSTSTAVEVVQQ